MPRYYFNISQGKYAGASQTALDFEDDDAAWKEMTQVGGDLVVDVMRNFAKKSHWQIEVLDEAKKALFRISLLTESLA
jgi:uncharacterized protein DUF6894